MLLSLACSETNPTPLRSYVVDNIFRLIKSALNTINETGHNSDANTETETETEFEKSNLEQSLLAICTPLILYSRRDTCEYSLKCFHDFLDAQGPSLSYHGWKVVLITLSAVAVPQIARKSSQVVELLEYFVKSSVRQELQQDQDIIALTFSLQANPTPISTLALGFQCSRLVSTDFIPSMPISCIEYCILCFVAYAVQVVDLNVCLSAAEMLWSLSDFIWAHISEKGDSEQISLWIKLLDSLRVLAADSRPEVNLSLMFKCRRPSIIFSF